MLKPIYVLLSMLLLLSCGGSGGGAGSNAGTNVFPKVAGKYAFNTSEFSVTCTDGSSGTSPKLSFNVVVSQDNNELTVTSANPSSTTPGFTIIEASDLTGLIKSDGSFSLTRTMITTISGIQDQETVNASLAGVFSDRDVFGDYIISIFFQDLLVTCKYTATFTGPKL